MSSHAERRPLTHQVAEDERARAAAAACRSTQTAWVAVPARHGLLQPVDDLLSALGMRPDEGAAHDDALQRLGHVEPRARDRRVEGQDAALQQPAHHVVRQMPRQIIPDQDQAQGRSGLGALIGPLPVLPGEQRMILRQERAPVSGCLVQVDRVPRCSSSLQPGMQHCIGGGQDAFGMHVSGGRAEKRQQLGGSPTHVLVWLQSRLAFRCQSSPGWGMA